MFDPIRVPNRKIDRRSKLKNLPSDLQEAILQYARNHTSEETAQWLREQGVLVSRPTVGRFLAWHRLTSKTARDSAAVGRLVEDIKSARPQISADDLDTAGHMLFSMIAILEEDSAAWKRVQQLGINRDMLKVAQKKGVPPHWKPRNFEPRTLNLER